MGLLDWKGKEIKQKVNKQAVSSLWDALEFLGEEADRTAPIDEGTLRRSRFVDVDEESLIGAVSYDTPYAPKVHEDFSIKFSDPSARNKWLELTAKEKAEKIVKLKEKYK